MRRILVCGLAAAVLAGAGACAAEHPDPASGPAGTAGPPGPAAAPPPAPDGLFLAIPLPLDPYNQTNGQVALLTAAFNVLDHACMKSRGYDYPPAAFLRPQQPPATPANFMRYGEDTEQAADLGRADFGYYQTGHRENPDPSLSLSPAEHTAQFGASGGCAQQAADRLSADGGAYTAAAVTAGSLDRQSYLSSLDDSRVKAVIASWSACMHGRGYPVDSPVGRQVDVFAWPRAERLADVACKHQVDLVRVWSEVETGIQQSLIAANAQALDLEKQHREATVHTAASVLAPSGR